MNARRLPSVTARDVIRVLQKAGFSIVRTTGSHFRLVHDTEPTRQTTVPVHKGKDIPRGTLRDIISKPDSRSTNSSTCSDGRQRTLLALNQVVNCCHASSAASLR